MSKTEIKSIKLTSLKSLGGGIPEFYMPVKVDRVDGTKAELVFKVKGLRRTDWAAARDAHIEAIIAKGEEDADEKFTLVKKVTGGVQVLADVVMKATTGWSLDEPLTAENLIAMEDMIPGALDATLTALDIAMFQGRVGN